MIIWLEGNCWNFNAYRYVSSEQLLFVESFDIKFELISLFFTQCVYVEAKKDRKKQDQRFNANVETCLMAKPGIEYIFITNLHICCQRLKIFSFFVSLLLRRAFCTPICTKRLLLQQEGKKLFSSLINIKCYLSCRWWNHSEIRLVSKMHIWAMWKFYRYQLMRVVWWQKKNERRPCLLNGARLANGWQKTNR